MTHNITIQLYFTTTALAYSSDIILSSLGVHFKYSFVKVAHNNRKFMTDFTTFNVQLVINRKLI